MNKLETFLKSKKVPLDDKDLVDRCKMSWDNAILNVQIFGGSSEMAIKEAKSRVSAILKILERRF